MAASVGDFLNFLSPFEHSFPCCFYGARHSCWNVVVLFCSFDFIMFVVLKHIQFFFTDVPESLRFFSRWCWSLVFFFFFFIFFCSPICWLLTVLLWVIYVINFYACNANKRNLFLYIIKVVTTKKKKKKWRKKNVKEEKILRSTKREEGIHCKSLGVKHK